MEEELSGEQFSDIIRQADEIGISFIVFAGGEPFMRQDILDIAANFPNIIFLIFTNGLLISDEVISKLKKLKNLIPVISIEGYENETDGRRGAGVFNKLMNILEQLKKNKIFFSYSITLTSQNYDSVMTDEYINKLYKNGGRLFFFIEYTPIKEGTEDWLLTDEKRQQVMERIKDFRSNYKALFISVPGDEEEIGGCLSAGRGFVHISASGNVEPCPFAPYSDTNLKETPLIEALQSEFLKNIREGSANMHETEGGCALWVEREWVKSMLNKENSLYFNTKEEIFI